MCLAILGHRGPRRALPSPSQPHKAPLPPASPARAPLRRPFLLVWAANRQTPIGNVEVKKSDSEWREALSPAAYDVLIKRGTERCAGDPAAGPLLSFFCFFCFTGSFSLSPSQRPLRRSGTSPLNREKRPGMFCCAGCRAPLFDQKTKFESGTGGAGRASPIHLLQIEPPPVRPRADSAYITVFNLHS